MDVSKQNVIKEAYGDEYDWNEDGWLIYGVDEASEFGYEPFGEYETRNHIDGVYEWRPKSLSGIENNNGWIKIESESDLPKEQNVDCYFIFKGKIEAGIYLRQHFERPKQNEVVFYKLVSHYQVIQYPQSPIY